MFEIPRPQLYFGATIIVVGIILARRGSLLKGSSMIKLSKNRASKTYPWLVWSLAALFYCYGSFQRVAPSVMVDNLMIDFGVNAAVLGNLSAFYFYAYASLQLPIGIMVDYWGPRRTLVGAALLCGIGSFLFANSDTITGAYFGRFLIGAGAGFTWVGTLTLASQWLPKSRFALVSGMTLMLGMIGAVLGQAPLASAVATFGWRNTLGGAALVAFIISVLIWNILVDKKTIVRPDAKTKITILFDSLKLTIKNP